MRRTKIAGTDLPNTFVVGLDLLLTSCSSVNILISLFKNGPHLGRCSQSLNKRDVNKVWATPNYFILHKEIQGVTWRGVDSSWLRGKSMGHNT